MQTDSTTPKKYYVYELRENGIAFYIGKGQGRRMYHHRYNISARARYAKSRRIRDILARGGTFEEIKVFETDIEEEAYAEEVRLIAFYGRANLTNQTDGGDGIRELSDEARERIAASRRGVKMSEETRRKLSARLLGKKHTDETKAKIAATQTGSKKPWASRPKSAEHQRKITEKLKGGKMPPGTGAKISAAKKGFMHSQATKDKIAATKTGTRLSQEHRNKISAANRRRYTKKYTGLTLF